MVGQHAGRSRRPLAGESPVVAAPLSRLFDDAGLFPPAQRAMNDAIAVHTHASAGPHAEIVGCFLCPVSGLDGLVARLVGNLAPAPPWDVVAVLDGAAREGLSGLAADVASLAGRPGDERFRIVAVEAALPPDVVRTGVLDAIAVLDGLPAGIRAFLELPVAGADPEVSASALDAIATAHEAMNETLAAKVRCGGTAREAFPSSAALASFIASCAERSVAIKATAGLHHALRHLDPELGVRQHGFVNLLAASGLALSGADPATLAAILEDEHGPSFALREGTISWRDSVVPPTHVGCSSASGAATSTSRSTTSSNSAGSPSTKQRRPRPFDPKKESPMVSKKPFASVTDTEEKEASVETLAEGVYAYTAQGDPNVGAIVGDDAMMIIDARATPALAAQWLAELRRLSDRPIRDLLLTHYHAVRVLGASAYGAERVLASDRTRNLIDERGQQDYESELGRFPRLFAAAEEIPGLTHPTETFTEKMTVDLGGRVVELAWLGRGHTDGDTVAWVPDCGVLFAGDLVEAEAAPYLGDAAVDEWRSATLGRVADYDPAVLVGGRGEPVRGERVELGIEDTRTFLSTTFDLTRDVRESGGSLKDAFDSVRAALAPRYGGYPIFEHCMPFNVQRCWDELSSAEIPIVWTADRDRMVWDALQG